MKLKDSREYYGYFSGKLSDVNRQLCFAGIAVIWIFVVKDSKGNFTFSGELLFPLGCFVLSLAFDLLHYIVSSASWGIFSRMKEKNADGKDIEFTAPPWINWIPLLFFWSKVIVTLFGFGVLLKLFLNFFI